VNEQNLAANNLQALQEQLQTLLVFLERPAVQQQVLAIVGVIIVALVLDRLLNVLLDRTVQNTDEDNFLRDKVLPAIGMTFFPLIGLGLTYGALQFFDANGYLNGLIQRFIQLFWLLLVYYGAVFVLYITLGEKVMLPWQRRVLTPVLVVTLVWLIARDFLDLQLLGDVSFIDQDGLSVSVGSIALALAIGYIFLTMGWATRYVLRESVFPDMGINEGVTNSVVPLIRYTILAVGLIVTLAVLGLNLTTLSFIAGGLSVGIGLGLQQIVSNFFSGIVMLFEQKLRPEDWIEIDGNLGVVQRIGIRSTTVRTLDNIDRIVPNESILTSTVSNLTSQANHRIRIRVDVGVGYDEDPREVKELLIRIARYHENVLTSPEPVVFFKEYGDSSINFALICHVSHPRHLYPTHSELMFDIFKEFDKRDIEIPYPQRDLNLRRGWEEVFGQQREEAQLPEGEPSDEAENQEVQTKEKDGISPG